MISITHLSKSYGKKAVLDNISLEFEKGKVHGIVGENGAGKTTLFRCIAGLEPFEGKVESTYQPLKDHLGFLPTDPYFFPKITGREYLQLLCTARGLKNVPSEEQNLFDLPLDEFAITYSTGMKKKLALTAILSQQNDCFILDEPFNGVDIHSNMLITAIIHKLKSLGKTIVLSSHIFSTLNDTCDNISLLQHGRLVKTVQKSDFKALEQEMSVFILGNKIESLG
ncbi:MAG: ABC transporter ATP-binding protein [Lewinellaceae bacterium]|nr:ABC transporter ATP-binding protein [Lewinellaceae bacterium]